MNPAFSYLLHPLPATCQLLIMLRTENKAELRTRIFQDCEVLRRLVHVISYERKLLHRYIAVWGWCFSAADNK
jgi:hypothetical protein